MKIERKAGFWWVVEVPDTVDACGPYGTRREAEDDLHGLVAFFHRNPDLEQSRSIDNEYTGPD